MAKTSQLREMPARTMPRSAAFMPTESPPLVRTAIFLRPPGVGAGVGRRDGMRAGSDGRLTADSGLTRLLRAREKRGKHRVRAGATQHEAWRAGAVLDADAVAGRVGEAKLGQNAVGLGRLGRHVAALQHVAQVLSRSKRAQRSAVSAPEAETEAEVLASHACARRTKRRLLTSASSVGARSVSSR